MSRSVANTPIEIVRIGARRVHVKRDDLYGAAPAPPLGKLRGLQIVLGNLYERGVRLVGAYDTRVSRLGEGLAAACRELPGMRALVAYPTKQGCEIPSAITQAEQLGALILPLRGNHVAICYAQAKRKVQSLGGVMLPFGLECAESVSAIAEEASTIGPQLSGGTLVLCCGSGVTLAGIITGLRHAPPQRALGISSGRSVEKIQACLRRYLGSLPGYVEIIPAFMPYDETPSIACPFPTHPNYDLKAWMYLKAHIRQLKDPVLFWNIGA